MADKNPMDDMLDGLFAEAKADPRAQVDMGLMTRVLDEADRLQPVAPTPASAKPLNSAPRRPLAQVLYDILGGWQGTSGLVAATMASVWIGFSGADSLSVESFQAVISGDAEYYLSDLSGEFSFDSEEG
ncbi:hypothetical protein NBRC116601_02010 [Cognatishimia sp. WU-CL00825]|uniref:hypothetical protein n=1 Tax=Cognatishimia sp. WU-CL00825 TaxID=3127658 RepID=UPI00310A9283